MSNDDLSRRDALNGGAAALALGVGAALAVTALPRDAQAQSAADVMKLNALLTAEYDAILTYTAAIGYLGAPDMGDPARAAAPAVLQVATAIRADHTAHAEKLQGIIMNTLQGTPVSRGSVVTPTLPPRFTLTVGNILKLGSNKEKAAAVVYMETLKTVSNATAAELTAAIGGIESMHFIVLFLAAKGIVAPNAMIDMMMLRDLAPRSFVALADPAAAPTTLSSLTNFAFAP